MPAVPRHLAVKPIGNSPQGESWTFAMRFSNNPAGAHELDGGQLQDIADSVAATYSGQGIPAQFKSSMSNALNVSGIRVEQVGPDGKIERAAEHSYSPVVGGTDAPQRPIQTALVISLNRGAQYGRSGRGRWYLPVPGNYPPMTADFRVQANTMGDYLSMVNNWQKAWGDAINSGSRLYSYELVVASPHLNKLTPVENIGLGDVFDSQRRRRDRWQETRITQDRL